MKNIAATLACAILIAISSLAQNVGINTTTPQATLDVKGGQRVGGGHDGQRHGEEAEVFGRQKAREGY